MINRISQCASTSTLYPCLQTVFRDVPIRFLYGSPLAWSRFAWNSGIMPSTSVRKSKAMLCTPWNSIDASSTIVYIPNFKLTPQSSMMWRFVWIPHHVIFFVKAFSRAVCGKREDLDQVHI